MREFFSGQVVVGQHNLQESERLLLTRVSFGHFGKLSRELSLQPVIESVSMAVNFSRYS